MTGGTALTGKRLELLLVARPTPLSLVPILLLAPLSGELSLEDFTTWQREVTYEQSLMHRGANVVATSWATALRRHSAFSGNGHEVRYR